MCDWGHTRKAGFEGVPELQMIYLVALRTVHDIPQPALVEDVRVRFADNLVVVDGAFLVATDLLVCRGSFAAVPSLAFAWRDLG